MMRMVEPNDIAQLVELRAKAISCLATGAVPDSDWADGVREQAYHILALADELTALMTPAPAAEVH